MSATLTVSRKLLIDEAPLIVLPTLAKHIGYKEALVIASLVMDGVMCVCTKAHQWEPYLELRAAFSSGWLRRAIAQGGVLGGFT
jgi:hypothetical protein